MWNEKVKRKKIGLRMWNSEIGRLIWKKVKDMNASYRMDKKLTMMNTGEPNMQLTSDKETLESCG